MAQIPQNVFSTRPSFMLPKAINKLKKCRNEFSFLSFSSWLTDIFREQNRINFREKIHGFVMILFGFELRTMVLRWQLVSPGIAPRAVGTGGQGDPSYISLTLFQSRGGQFMPTTLLLSPSGFQTFLRHRTNVARPQNKSTKPRLILVVCCAVCTKEDSNSDKMEITFQKVQCENHFHVRNIECWFQVILIIKNILTCKWKNNLIITKSSYLSEFRYVYIYVSQ